MEHEIGAGVAGLGRVELLVEPGEGVGAPRRGERVEPDEQVPFAGVDVAGAGECFADEGVGLVFGAGVVAVKVAGERGLLASYITMEAIRSLVTGDRAQTSIAGLVLTAGTAVFEPVLGVAKRRIGAWLGSAATAGEGTQNCCAPTWPSRCSLAGPWSKGGEPGSGTPVTARASLRATC